MAEEVDGPFGSWATGLAALLTVLITVAAVWYWQRDAGGHDGAPLAAAVPTAESAATVLTAPTAAQQAALSAPALREPGLKLDSNGLLVPDRALRALMDSYLAAGPAQARQARVPALRAKLAAGLSPAAAAAAGRLIASYAAYLDARARMLARERFDAAPDAALSEAEVAHLLSWQDQQTQLRQRLLGPALAQAWFEGEDGRCLVMLQDWQKQHVPPDPAQEADPVELHEQRMHGDALRARRDADAQACAAQMRPALMGAN